MNAVNTTLSFLAGCGSQVYKRQNFAFLCGAIQKHSETLGKLKKAFIKLPPVDLRSHSIPYEFFIVKTSVRVLNLDINTNHSNFRLFL